MGCGYPSLPVQCDFIFVTARGTESDIEVRVGGQVASRERSGERTTGLNITLVEIEFGHDGRIHRQLIEIGVKAAVWSPESA